MTVGAVAVSAGCLGYTVEDEDDVENRKDRIDSLEEDRESLESSNEDLEEQLSAVEADLDDSQAKQILYLYSWGLTHQNNASSAYNDAYSYLESSNFRAARAEFNLSAGYYHSATNNFNGAAERAAGLGEPTVESYCTDAKSRCELMDAAVANYQTAMYHYANGEQATAQSYIDSGDANYTDAQQDELHDLATLESELSVTIDQ